MWKVYSLAWLGYSCLIAFVVQIENVSKGQFSVLGALKVFGGTLPAPLILALVWPLSNYLVKAKLPLRRVLLVHSGSALLFGSFVFFLSYVVLAEIFGYRVRRDLGTEVWPFLYNLMMYAVTAAAFHGILAGRASRQQALAISQAQNLLIAAELSALRNKLNPHFLFNTLHSIIALVRKDSQAAETALFHFSDMLRYILDAEKRSDDHVTLDDELQFIRDYLDLEALRLGSRLQVHWVIDEQLLGVSLPALSIQPLVENSIKHAFNPRSQAGNLRISCQKLGDGVQIVVADDGPGADPAQLGAALGMGIKTVERRLLLEFGDAAKLQIVTAPGQGFQVSYLIPCSDQL